MFFVASSSGLEYNIDRKTHTHTCDIYGQEGVGVIIKQFQNHWI